MGSQNTWCWSSLKDASIEKQGYYVFDITKSILKLDILSVPCIMSSSGHHLPLKLRNVCQKREIQLLFYLIFCASGCTSFVCCEIKMNNRVCQKWSHIDCPLVSGCSITLKPLPIMFADWAWAKWKKPQNQVISLFTEFSFYNNGFTKAMSLWVMGGIEGRHVFVITIELKKNDFKGKCWRTF